MARILIVDDEEAIRELIKEVLTPAGHEILLAMDGAHALDLLEKKTVDLAIVDRNMPVMTGIEAVYKMRRNPKTAGIKVLMCTAASVTTEIDEAFNVGADDYLLKPLNFAHLLAKVAKTLASPPRAK
jgi:two-component system chemotaxis response regulator CheY